MSSIRGSGLGGVTLCHNKWEEESLEYFKVTNSRRRGGRLARILQCNQWEVEE